MKVEVVPAASLAPEQLECWARIQQEDGVFASPFFSPQFTRIVAEARDDVYVGVLEQEGRVVGFFPFQRGRWGAGRPVGYTISDYQGVVVESGAAWDAKELIRACGLKVWEFDHMIGVASQFRPFERRRSESPFMDLSRGFEVYLRERRDAGVGEIVAAQRKMRKLEREQGELRFEPQAVDPEVLATLMHWKTQQYLRSGGKDVLARPWIRQALALALATREEDFAGVMSLLFAGDRLVAAHLGLRSSTIWHYWFPAYDPELGRYSPGLALLLRMAEHASSLGLQAVDLGRGDARYKRSLMSATVPLIEGSVEVLSAAAAVGRARRGTRAMVRRTSIAPKLRRLGRRVLGRGPL